jgi:hypothetical protein
MKKHVIRYSIKGLKTEGGYVRFQDLIDQLRALGNVLKEFDFLVSKEKAPTTYYRVVGLHHSEPAIDLEPVTTKEELDYTAEINAKLFTEMKNIEKQGIASRDVSWSALESIQRLIEPIGKKFSSATLSGENVDIEMDTPFRSNIERLISSEEKEERCHGSLEGWLEAINLHADINEFRIYPLIGPKVVVCKFQKEQRELAKESLDRFVLVSGVMKYRSREKFPYEILVEDIVKHPKEDDIPHLFDLNGIAPDATEGTSSEDFVRKLRKEW